MTDSFKKQGIPPVRCLNAGDRLKTFWHVRHSKLAA